MIRRKKRILDVTLTDIWRQEEYNLDDELVNLIISPVGSGKTYFVFNELIKGYNLNEVIYLCDTSNLERAVRKDKNYNHLLSYRSDLKEFSQYGLHEGFERNKIQVMTYAKFGYDIEKNPNCFDDKKLIICDEAHNLIKYQNRYDNDDKQIYTQTINKLFELNDNKKSKVVLLTATPSRIIFNEEITTRGMRKYNFYGKVRELITLNERKFSNIKNLKEILKEWQTYFDVGYKALMYTDSIKTSIKIVEEFKEMGLNAIPLWSTNNTKYKMSEGQKIVYDSIIESGKIPFGVDVVIINGSYETGINIHDDTVKIVIVNNSNEETIEQVRGRVRDEVISLITKSKIIKKEDFKINLDEKWLNRDLFKLDKDELVNNLNLHNSTGRQFKWTSIKRILKEQGYKIEDKAKKINGKTVKVSIIEDKEK